MYAICALACTLLATPTTLAHMALVYPSSFNATNNPHRTTSADPYLEYPYDCCGENDRWEYPCRGYHTLLGTPQGAPTATWESGSLQTWNISGIGNHWGGSCQVGFSSDRGRVFRVAASYEGNCPHRYNGNGPAGQDFDFTVPPDIEPGIHIFAWMWHNREQEFNMNCAAVNIITPMPTPYHSPSSILRQVTFNDRPLMFVADNGNNCLTPHTTAELKYPDPGPDVIQGDGVYPLALPVGACSPEEMLATQAYTNTNGNHRHR